MPSSCRLQPEKLPAVDRSWPASSFPALESLAILVSLAGDGLAPCPVFTESYRGRTRTKIGFVVTHLRNVGFGDLDAPLAKTVPHIPGAPVQENLTAIRVVPLVPVVPCIPPLSPAFAPRSTLSADSGLSHALFAAGRPVGADLRARNRGPQANFGLGC